MWTGGKPPSLPQQALKKPETTTTSSSGVVFRSTLVNSELEALKQRGLAKILNKHFTDTAKKLAEEKAAADAALADLERRKANTSEFQFSGNMELSPLDNMYVSVNAWRNECRRKERETLLLYQRYVDKFGSTGQVRLPETSTTTTTTATTGGLLQQPTTIPKNTTKDAQSWMNKRNDDGSVGASSTILKKGLVAPPTAPPAQLVPTMAAEIERTLDEYIQRGALSVPSVEVLGIEQTFQTAASKEEAEFRNYYRRQLEQRGIDAKSPEKAILEKKDAFVGPGWVDALGPGMHGIVSPSSTTIRNRRKKNSTAAEGSNDETNDDDDDDENQDICDPNFPFRGRAYHFSSADDNDEDEDDGSVVSGLTSIHSQITRSVIHDCEKSVYEFLREERNYIKGIIQEEDEDERSQNKESIRATTKATIEAENMVKQMQDILTEYQVKHIEATTNNDIDEPRRFLTDNPDEHWMIYYDEFYQQDYYHELNTNQTQWEPPSNGISPPGKDGSSLSVSGTGSDHSIAASAAFDNASISSTKAVLLSSDDVIPDSHHGLNSSSNRLMMMGGSKKSTSLRTMGYESRITQYRKKRRLERKKRKIVALILFVIACMVGGSYYYCINYRPELVSTITVSMEQYWNEMMLLIKNMDNNNTTSSSTDIHNVNYNETNRDVIDNNYNTVTKPLKTPNVVKPQFETDVIAKVTLDNPTQNDEKDDDGMDELVCRENHDDDDDDDSKCKDEKETTTKNMIPTEEKEQHNTTTTTNASSSSNNNTDEEEEEEVVVVVDDDTSSLLMVRPWACNLPFAYLFHRRCNHLAKQNPLFDLQELILLMMQ